VHPRLAQILSDYTRPVPTPAGMTSRELVRRAIRFEDPPRIPYSFVVPLESDFFEVILADRLSAERGPDRPTELGAIYYDEWGVGQEVTGRGWDHAFEHPLADLSQVDDFPFPDLAAVDRFERLRPFIEEAARAGKYVVGFDPIMAFERMRSLVGFEELMVAPYIQPDGLRRLIARLTDLTVAIVNRWADLGQVDAFMTWEDWGLQTGLQMKIDTFREFYRPHYARIADAAHARGLHFIWHNCGQILDMIPDMIDMGVDVVQLDQPRLMGHDRLAQAFGGRICFWNTVDIQWSVEPGVTEGELRAEAKRMRQAYGRFHGGFMARQYPQPQDIELAPERCLAIAQAFRAEN